MIPMPKPKPQQRPIVYVRAANPKLLPPELQNMPGRVYALHDVAGNQIALAPDREHAFALAVKNDLVPISAH
ncbi:MAG: DUF1150 family protein [Pikeienuella sp.]